MYTVHLQPETPAGAAPLTLTAKGGVRVGFTDTLWFGEDHFSSCHHLAGQGPDAMYKPGGQNSGTLVELEVRDRFPDTDTKLSLPNTAAGASKPADIKAPPASAAQGPATREPGTAPQ